jgi:uncharacterized Zn-finger protein
MTSGGTPTTGSTFSSQSLATPPSHVESFPRRSSTSACYPAPYTTLTYQKSRSLSDTSALARASDYYTCQPREADARSGYLQPTHRHALSPLPPTPAMNAESSFSAYMSRAGTCDDVEMDVEGPLQLTVLGPLQRSKSDTIQPSTANPLALKYECEYCGKGFSRPSSLKVRFPFFVTNTRLSRASSHRSISIPIPAKSVCTASLDVGILGMSLTSCCYTAFQCPYEGCGRWFSVLSNMRRHARVHMAPDSDTSRTGSRFSEEGFEGPVSLSAAPSYDSLRAGAEYSPSFAARGLVAPDEYDNRYIR